MAESSPLTSQLIWKYRSCNAARLSKPSIKHGKFKPLDSGEAVIDILVKLVFNRCRQWGDAGVGFKGPHSCVIGFRTIAFIGVRGNAFLF
jgi:hypothetical protein